MPDIGIQAQKALPLKIFEVKYAGSPSESHDPAEEDTVGSVVWPRTATTCSEGRSDLRTLHHDYNLH
jgi:hypothetical protein